MHLLGGACIGSRRGKVLERQGKHSAWMLAGAKTGGPDGLGLREGERQRGHAWTRMQESGMHLLVTFPHTESLCMSGPEVKYPRTTSGHREGSRRAAERRAQEQTVASEIRMQEGRVLLL